LCAVGYIYTLFCKLPKVNILSHGNFETQQYFKNYYSHIQLHLKVKLEEGGHSSFLLGAVYYGLSNDTKNINVMSET